MSHIEDLSKRIEEQEDIIAKHEQLIQQLVNYVNNNQHQHPQTVPHRPSSRPRRVYKAQPQKPQPPQEDKVPGIVEMADSDDSELDNELIEELKELQETSPQAHNESDVSDIEYGT